MENVEADKIKLSSVFGGVSLVAISTAVVLVNPHLVHLGLSQFPDLHADTIESVSGAATVGGALGGMIGLCLALDEKTKATFKEGLTAIAVSAALFQGIFTTAAASWKIGGDYVAVVGMDMQYKKMQQREEKLAVSQP